MKKLLSGLLVASVLLSLTVPALAAWTIDQRQFQLMQDINQAQKTKQISEKDANKLRKKLSNIARKKTKMKEKGAGSLTDKDKRDLESDLNDVSVEITKLKLDKRAEDPKDK